MFDSGYPCDKLVCEVESETNLAYPVTKEAYLAWLNHLEQLLYSDIIREEKLDILPYRERLCMAELMPDGFSDQPRVSDVGAVFLKANGRTHEMERLPLTEFTRGIGSAHAYAAAGESLIFRRKDGESDGKLHIIRYIRPPYEQIYGGKITGTVRLPEEFLEMVRCKLRGEKYRLMNEDLLCAKWIGEYNYHLETFKAFIEKRRARL